VPTQRRPNLGTEAPGPEGKKKKKKRENSGLVWQSCGGEKKQQLGGSKGKEREEPATNWKEGKKRVASPRPRRKKKLLKAENSPKSPTSS